MPRLGRLDGNRRRLGIPDLPHHDDVRILPEDGTEAAREGHPRLPVELNLADVVDPVFDRILEGDDVRIRAVEFIQDGVEARALSASRRPGAQNHPVGLPDHRVDLVPVRFDHPEAIQGIDARAHVEQTQDDVLPMDRGHGGDADVDLPLIHLEGEAAVLRDP